MNRNPSGPGHTSRPASCVLTTRFQSQQENPLRSHSATSTIVAIEAAVPAGSLTVHAFPGIENSTSPWPQTHGCPTRFLCALSRDAPA